MGGISLAGMPAIGRSQTVPSPDAQQSDDPDDIYQLDYPDVAAIGGHQLFGYKPATEAERARASAIINQTPKGPAPVDVAQSFVDRFYASEPKVISQWPRPDNWNPLVVGFFGATTTKATSDMVAWCAAFANSCLMWSGRTRSNSAASQSFLEAPFRQTASPKRGDLAVFTCYDSRTGKSLGLGHVTFFVEPIDNRYIKVVGGNQSTDGHSSIISNERFPIYERDVHRHVNGAYIPCKMRLNRYVAIS